MWMALFAVSIVLIAIGLLYQWIGSRRDLQRFPPPGRLIDVGGVPLHIRVAGSGNPPAVFESGIAASSVSWRPVQDAVAAFTTAAAYDRAGFAWSSASPKALDAGEMVDAARSLLRAMELQPPYVLVGHSFGALLMRLYADRWPEEVAGLVLVDPALVHEWSAPSPARLKMLGRGVTLSRRGSLLAKIGFVRFSLMLLTSGMHFLPKLLSKATSGKGHAVSSRLVGEVRKLPPELWPAVQSHWCRPESFESMARHLACLPDAAARVNQARPLGPIPVTVISGAHLTDEQRQEHAAIAASSHHGRHVVAPNSAHWVHLDNPDTVIAAIREMVTRSTESHLS